MKSGGTRRNPIFQKLPIDEAQAINRDCIKLWRAVLDQALIDYFSPTLRPEIEEFLQSEDYEIAVEFAQLKVEDVTHVFDTLKKREETYGPLPKGKWWPLTE